jgi:hypothetical protein
MLPQNFGVRLLVTALLLKVTANWFKNGDKSPHSKKICQMGLAFHFMKNAAGFCRVVLLLLAWAVLAQAQSTDPGSPAPIRRSNLQGKIAARDLGDSRLTDHYYAFTGTPGDLLITVQSHNLNGDLDVFTAVTLRPLLKLPLYAESTAPVTKGIYLRKREDLILRIEARSPNDDPGTYQLYFGGSFEAIVGGPDIEETEAPPAAATIGGDKKTKRVSSVGARIEESTPSTIEVASAPTPEPSPAVAPIESPAPTLAEKPAATEPAPKPAAPVTTARGNPRNTRTTGRRTSTPTKPRETAPAAEVSTTTNPAATTETPAESKPVKTPSRNTSRRGSTTTRTPKPPSESTSASTSTSTSTRPPAPEIGPRLIIETNDGTLINRSMSTVRRVLVENGQVVVVGKDGKIDRILLLNVVKMAIQP